MQIDLHKLNEMNPVIQRCKKLQPHFFAIDYQLSPFKKMRLKALLIVLHPFSVNFDSNG